MPEAVPLPSIRRTRTKLYGVGMLVTGIILGQLKGATVLRTIFRPCHWLLLFVRHLVKPLVLLKGFLAILGMEVGVRLLAILLNTLYPYLNLNGAQIRASRAAVNDATSYDEWRDAATKLDIVEGHDHWKRDAQDDALAFDAIATQVARLQSLSGEGCATPALLQELQSCLQRCCYRQSDNAMVYQRLVFTLALAVALVVALVFAALGVTTCCAQWSRAHVGTKLMLHEWQDAVLRAIEVVHKDHGIAGETKQSWLKQARAAHGNTALVLSGGAAMGWYHLGVIKALHQHRLLPQIVAGSSAGSVIAAMLGVTPPELRDQRVFEPEQWCRPFLALASKHGGNTFHRRFGRFAAEGAILDIEQFTDELRAQIGDFTFAEAFALSGLDVCITVTPTDRSLKPMLLSRVSHPNVLLWSAAAASCAIPGLFSSVRLYQKAPDGTISPCYESFWWCDGSVSMDIPGLKLAEQFNVTNLIVSQVNPLLNNFAARGVPPVIPWSSRLSITKASATSSTLVFFQVVLETLRTTAGTQLLTLLTILKSCFSVMLPQHSNRNRVLLVLRGLATAVDQSFGVSSQQTGITIVPPFKLFDLATLLANGDPQSVTERIRDAERSSWPLMSRIEFSRAIELALLVPSVAPCTSSIASRKSEPIKSHL